MIGLAGSVLVVRTPTPSAYTFQCSFQRDDAYCVENSMNIVSSITFDSAEHEYNEAWSAPSSTRFELPPVDVNKVLKERYRISPERTLTRAKIWDMETKKAWDPLTYIPYVVSQARSWDRTTLRDGTTRFCRSSLQRGWITSKEGRVLEDVFVSEGGGPTWRSSVREPIGSHRHRSNGVRGDDD
jgi:hypothetical protein